MTSLLPSFMVGNRGLGGALGVIHGEVRQLDPDRELVLLLIARRRLDEAYVVEDHLAFVHRPLVEHLGGNVFRGKVNALTARLFQHGREQSHFELESQHIHTGRAALAALRDDFLDEQPPNGQVYRPDHHQPAVARPVEEAVLRRRAFAAAKARGLVRAQDQLAELVLFLGERLRFLLLRQPAADVQIRLPLIAAKIQHLEGAESPAPPPSSRAARR